MDLITKIAVSIAVVLAVAVVLFIASKTYTSNVSDQIVEKSDSLFEQIGDVGISGAN